MREIIVGIDEVGRGALAGPVMVGAATFYGADSEALLAGLETVLCRKLTDSKHLTCLQRERVVQFLQGKVLWANGAASPTEIDTLGLTRALTIAAGRALAALPSVPTKILADAGLGHPCEIPTEHFIKGDEKIPEISVASILVKVWRDAIMREHAVTYPDYGWAQNVGYGTPQHYAALKNYGLTPEHRLLFCRKLPQGV